MRRRVPFIWLPQQRVDHAAAFASLRGASNRRSDEGTNRWVLARRSFAIDDPVRYARLLLTVDGRYRLWINGQHVGDGPVRGSPWFQRLDQLDVGGHLRVGANVIAVLVHVPGVDLAWYEAMRGGWQPAFGDGGLFADLAVTMMDGKTLNIHSDSQWRMHLSRAWQQEISREGWGQDFLEDFDANELGPEWISEHFDDRDWSRAQIMRVAGGAVEQARGWGPVEPFPTLLASEIPRPVESIHYPSELLWVKSVQARPDLPLESRLYMERFCNLTDQSVVSHVDALLTDGAGGCEMRTPPDGDLALMLAFDSSRAARPFIEFEASGGEILEIAVAESIPGEFGRGTPCDGFRLEGQLHCSHVFRYRARPGWQRFEKFNWTAVRAMQLVVRNAPGGIRIHRLGIVATHYPAVPEGSFRCSDPVLTRLWDVGRNTVLQCMHDAWVDCPGREARQWVGDAVVQFDVAAAAFGPSVYPLQRQFLAQVAENQRQDGLVRMFAPGDSGADGLVIPDYTLLWIIGAARYWRLTGDDEGIDRIMPAMERALAWFERQRDEHGLIVDVPYWHFIEWADIGRGGQSAAINALYVGALASCGNLAEQLGRPRLQERCKRLGSQTAKSLNHRHWDEQRGVYVDSVDGITGNRRQRVSQHANALMVLFGIAPPDREARLIDAITDSPRLKLTAAPPIVRTGMAFDECTDVVRVNSFFAHFVYDGIARAGRFDWVLREMRDRYGPMLDAGATTLWESFEPTASLCHGFSATPVFQLTRHALGIVAEAAQFSRFMVQPAPGDLEWAEGCMPTPRGPISVRWRRIGATLELSVDHPPSCQLAIKAPLGYVGESIAADSRTGFARFVRSKVSN